MKPTARSKKASTRSSAAEQRRLAVIDIGTNSIHLLLVSIDAQHGRFKVIGRDREAVRLGMGSEDMKFLNEPVLNRGIAAIKRFKQIADSAGAEVRAVATSAVREARNQDEFIHRVRTETDVEVEVASGFEEARLTYLGVLESVPNQRTSMLLVDIGGGSSEFVVGSKGEIKYTNSLRLGAVRLTQKFFPDGTAGAKSIRSCREYVAGYMNPLTRDLSKLAWKAAVGSSGTVLALAKMVRAARGESTEAKIGGTTIARDELMRLVARIAGAKTVAERRKIAGLEPSRADIVVAGAIILEQVFSELKLKELTASEYALREGIVMDTIAKRFAGGPLDFHDDPRYRSVLHLAAHYRIEMQHALQVARLSLRIFDQTAAVHKLGDTEREYLEAAAILHEIGSYISHAQHHHHSYYLIRHAELLGFTDKEIEIIANVARYHRKSHPKMTHEGYAWLTVPDQERVKKLAAILRIADGLDRTHSSVIKDVVVRVSKGQVRFHLQPSTRSTVHWEEWAAQQKCALFEETFGVLVGFRTPHGTAA